MSAAGENMERIYRAIDHHDATCAFPAHTILLNSFEIERMGWEEGDLIRGCTVKADPKLGTGSFRLLCDKNKPLEELEEELEDKLDDVRKREEVLV